MADLGINWALGAPGTDPAAGVFSAFQQGRQEKRQADLERALGALGPKLNNPDALGTITALDPGLGVNLRNASYQQGEHDREAETRRLLGLYYGAGVGGPDQPPPVTVPPTAAAPGGQSMLPPAAAPVTLPSAGGGRLDGLSATIDGAVRQEAGAPAPPAPVAPPAAPPPMADPATAAAGGMTRADILRQLAVHDPATYQALQASELERRSQQIKTLQSLTDYSLSLLGGVSDQASYDVARQRYQTAVQSFGLPAVDLPATYSPDVVRQLRMSALSVKEQLEAEKPIAAPEGTDLFNPVTGQVVVHNPKPDTLQHFEVHNADGTTTPYSFNPKTGETRQLREGGGPGASAGDVAGVGMSPKAAEVASTLSAANLPAPVVAGFMGNFHVEGGYDGAQGDGGSASGIGQWHADRAAQFERVIGKPVAEASATDQARFVVWEMQNPEAAGMTVKQRDAILAAKTPAEAASLIDQFYERSSGRDRQTRMAAATAFAQGPSTPAATAQSGGVPISGKPLSSNGDDADTVKFYGQRVALGDQMPVLGMGKDAASMRRQILAEATKQWKLMGIDPGEAMAMAATNKSGLAELSRIANIRANVLTAENTANSNAGQVLTVLGSAGTTGSPIFNAWQQAGRRATGDGKVAAFDVAVKTLATEYARVMTGGGTSPLSDSARHEADQLLHGSMTPDQFRGAIRQMKIDMANRSGGIEQERQSVLNSIRTGGRGGGTTAPAAPQSFPNAPAVGTVRAKGGVRWQYKGGDPSSPSSWAKL